MLDDLQTTHLRTLVTIADEGGFEAAANRIGRTQSAVTQQMQRLEETVGTKLFEVQGRRRVLTEEGRTLLRHARTIVLLCRQAVIDTARAGERGTVTIGAPQEVAEEILPDVLDRFARTWPETRIAVHVGRSPELMTMLENHRLDITLSTRRSDRMEGTLLTRRRAVWIAGSKYRYEPGTPVPLVLADEPSMFRQIALAALDVRGLDYRERLTSPSLAGIRLAVAAGIGITARTQSAFFDRTRLLGEADGLPDLPSIAYYIYRLPSERSRAADDLFELIRNHEPVSVG